jgi:3-hydroxyacyl-CoA dehydrogenase/enoyl-CoA hydratase/3-hydroxybutyryl-CoA epimerase
MLYESKSFRLEADDQVVTLWLDFRDRPSHTLTLTLLNELSLVLDRIATFPAAEIVIIRSSSANSFLEEFDSTELCRFTSPLQFAALARRGQEVARKLSGLEGTTIAMIEGRCFGAGLELVLACDCRLAVDSASTRFESPEVSRGLVPCCGGTYRLPRLVGAKSAFRLLCQNESLAATAAQKCGLVDFVTTPARAGIDLQTLVDRLRDRPGKHRRAPFWQRVLRLFATPELAGLRRLPANGTAQSGSAEDEVVAVLASGRLSEGDALAAERAAFARLAASESTQALLDLHRRSTATIRVVPEPLNPIPPVPRRVGIVGTGDVATFLAWRLSRRGHEVVLREPDDGGRGQVDRALAGLAAQSIRSGEVSRAEGRRVQQAIAITADWVGFENADLVIEASEEDPGIKRNLFQELETRVRPRVPLVSAGSTVTVEAVQAEMSRPGRIAGLSFPNPFDVRPLAEVVGTPLTDAGILCALIQWSRQWGFTPVRVADRPGRLVELIRMTYLAEGVTLVAEGLAINQIDAGCRSFGMARGPLEWCDEIGLDRLAERTAQLQLARGDGFARCLLFQRFLPYGLVGKSVGEGFYRYGLRRTPSRLVRMVLWQDLDDDATAPYVFDADSAQQEGIDRIVLRTVNEAARALVDEPDADPATVDLALAYGMGWAPHRGGPLRYADQHGLQPIVDRLALFAERFGPRFVPCDELVRRAEAGETFYSGTAAESQAPAWRMVG